MLELNLSLPYEDYQTLIDNTFTAGGEGVGAGGGGVQGEVRGVGQTFAMRTRGGEGRGGADICNDEMGGGGGGGGGGQTLAVRRWEEGGGGDGSSWSCT